MRAEKRFSLQKVVIEGDSLGVINALAEGPGCLSSYGNVIDDILALADDFQLCEFSHVKRVCNVVTDMLAKIQPKKKRYVSQKG